jgi:hypothetical protein
MIGYLPARNHLHRERNPLGMMGTLTSRHDRTARCRQGMAIGTQSHPRRRHRLNPKGTVLGINHSIIAKDVPALREALRPQKEVTTPWSVPTSSRRSLMVITRRMLHLTSHEATAPFREREATKTLTIVRKSHASKTTIQSESAGHKLMPRTGEHI